MSEENVTYKSVPLKEKYEGLPINEAPKGFGVRHIQALILFICLSCGYSMRAHLSVSIVAMSPTFGEDNICKINNTSDQLSDLDNTTYIYNTTDVNGTDIVTFGNNTFIDSNHTETDLGWSVYRTYKWKKSRQEMILWAFFVGYTTMMIPMGMMAQRYGGKRPIMVALGANGVLSLLTPWVPIFGSWKAVCMVRLLQGMTQAAFYPSIHTILGKWAPLSERGRLSTYIYTGSQFGTVLAFQLAGLFAGSPSLGWPASFWLAGVVSLVCFCLLAWLGASTPHDHPSISVEEFAFITGDGSVDVVPKKRKTPWRHILTCKAVWGLVATHAGSSVSYLLILTQIPLYMDKILGVDIKRNGVFSSLPYICMYVLTLVFGSLSDFCVNKRVMSIANIRRVANSIGMVLPGILLVAFSYVHSTLIAVILLVCCVGLHSGIHVGFHINQIDLAPNFAGPIMSLGNMIGSLSSLIGPVLVSNIIGDDVTNQHKWQILFIITASVMFLTNIAFVVFAKGVVQPWNFYGDEDEENEPYSLNEKNKAPAENAR